MQHRLARVASASRFTLFLPAMAFVLLAPGCAGTPNEAPGGPDAGPHVEQDADIEPVGDAGECDGEGLRTFYEDLDLEET